MIELLEEMWRTRVAYDEAGRPIDADNMLSREEGHLLYDLIKSDTAISNTLEIGCAFGSSSLCICSALADRPGARLSIIDPFQSADWKSIGVLNLKRSGFTCFELIEEGSEYALPRLAKAAPGSFDLIFVDGFHTFDHTLIDLFYATKVLRIGGYLIVDDAHWPSVGKVVRYYELCPCFRRVTSTKALSKERGIKLFIVNLMFSLPMFRKLRGFLDYHLRQRINGSLCTMVVLKKVAEDRRPENWHQSDF
jgi:predicted O-methyltransferase YrrM